METQAQSQNIPTPALKVASLIRVQRLPVFKLAVTPLNRFYQGPVSDMFAVTSALKAPLSAQPLMF